MRTFLLYLTAAVNLTAIGVCCWIMWQLRKLNRWER
jgi:hypothetical protein